MESKLLKDFIFASKYARIKEDGKKETYKDAVSRVMNMHHKYITDNFVKEDDIAPILENIEKYYSEQKILGSQRALQWGGEQLLTKHSRMYNCASSYADRLEFFPHLMFLLMSGAGVGYSVQKHHIRKIPTNLGIFKFEPKVFKIEDSIEGWSDAIKELLDSYFDSGIKVEFDYSAIRPKGSPISGGFLAPGHKPLEIAIEKLRVLLDNSSDRKLTSVEVSDMACIIADSVISGGVRRSALIAIFSIDDNQMLEYKTGDWITEHPYRSRVNVSAAVLPETSKDQFDQIFKNSKEFGEPGIAFLKDRDYMYNPCFEVGMYPQIDGKSGFSFCNLVEVVLKNVKPDEFIDTCRVASQLSTIQASYATFDYLGEITEMIVGRDSLIGVGLTGISENLEICSDPDLLESGAKAVIDANIEMAELIGISPAARTTVVKPSGNSATMVGTSSGIHPFHSRRFIRNVQVNKQEPDLQKILISNPKLVEQSFYNDNDMVVSFPVEVGIGSVTKAESYFLDFVEFVGFIQKHWVNAGTNKNHPSYEANPGLTHNVSNTISVPEDGWDELNEFLWNNRSMYSGISMLPDSGDLDYRQAPYIEVLNEKQIVNRYGVGSILASGLIVDGIKAFGGIWEAVSDLGKDFSFNQDEFLRSIKSSWNQFTKSYMYESDGVIITDINAILSHHNHLLKMKSDWVRRFNQFADRYMDGDKRNTELLLKHVNILHKWENIKDTTPVEFSDHSGYTLKYAGEDVAAACSGGKCDI